MDKIRRHKVLSLIYWCALAGFLCWANHSLAQNEEGNISVDFKDADIQSVLRILSEKGGVNIISGKEVVGTVTIKLDNVPWEKALSIILKTNGYGCDREGNIISVMPFDKLTAQKQAEQALDNVQPLISEVFVLRFIDANDAKKVLEPQLSPRGKITVVQMTGMKGWEFASAGGTTKLARKSNETRSKTLVISEAQSSMDKIKQLIKKIDVMPRQVMIETKIVEVNKDRLKDLGLEWGTGSTGAESATMSPVPLRKTEETFSRVSEQAAIHNLESVTPTNFGPKATSVSPVNTGLKIVWQKLTGTQFEVMLHALEEDVSVNTLSNPRLMTLDNQEATILVGSKYPILETNVAGTDSTTTTTSLSYYQDIGIQLNVVPQICGDNYINMIVHPAVTSSSTTVGTNQYPVLLVREAETQILMKDGETVVIGGLLKDVKSKGKYSVPIIGKIPILGLLFTRETDDTEKIDLLIFITAKIVETAEAAAPQQ